MRIDLARLVFSLGLTTAGLLVGAAAPSDTAIAPLSLPAGSEEFHPKHTISARGGMFQAAPVPNPDASGPSEASRPEPQLGPTFISSRSLFKGDGDGYSFASSEEASMDGRRRAAAGLGLSLPLSDEK